MTWHLRHSARPLAAIALLLAGAVVALGMSAARGATASASGPDTAHFNLVANPFVWRGQLTSLGRKVVRRWHPLLPRQGRALSVGAGGMGFERILLAGSDLGLVGVTARSGWSDCPSG